MHVAPFIERGAGRVKISSNGGQWPRWSSDGKEIFYVETGPNGISTLMMAAVSQRGIDLRVDSVKPLFKMRRPGLTTQGYFYAPAPDGQRFLVNMEPDIEAEPAPITVILNWAAGRHK